MPGEQVALRGAVQTGRAGLAQSGEELVGGCVTEAVTEDEFGGGPGIGPQGGGGLDVGDVDSVSLIE
jgi:hypothetical protein